jgi:hypothetical protein
MNLAPRVTNGFSINGNLNVVTVTVAVFRQCCRGWEGGDLRHDEANSEWNSFLNYELN